MNLAEILLLPVSASSRVVYADDQEALYYIPAGAAGAAAKPSGSPATLELLTTAARKTLSSYDAVGGPVAGVTRVTTSTDSPGILWTLAALPVTADSSWIGLPYTVDPDGGVIVSMELADVENTVPSVNVAGVSGGVLSLGDGRNGGDRVSMNRKPNGYLSVSFIAAGAGKSFSDLEVKQTGGSGIAYSINGGAVVFVAAADGVTANIGASQQTNGALWEALIWPAASATSGKVGDITSVIVKDKNEVVSYDPSDLPELTELSISGEHHLRPDLFGLPKLTRLYIMGSPHVGHVDTGQFPLLEGLILIKGHTQSVDFSNNPLLTGCNLQEVDIVDLNTSGLTLNITVQSCPLLESFTLGDIIYTCIVSNNPNLTSVLNDGSFTGIASELFPFEGMCPWFANNNLTTDAVYDFIASLGNAMAGFGPQLLGFVGNPADNAGGGTLMTDGATYTQADVQTLINSKGWTLVFTDGQLAPV